MGKRLALVALVILAAVLALSWPRINDVETGRTPEYPDLKVRDFKSPVPQVTRAAETAMARLGWDFVGSGSGPRGAELRGVHTNPILRLREEVTIRVSTVEGHARVSVRSRSTLLPWDFGQNARNVRDFCRALDGSL
jgi:hypothetical protein